MEPWKQVFIPVLAGRAFFFWQYLERHHAGEAERCRKKVPHQTQLISCDHLSIQAPAYK